MEMEMEMEMGMEMGEEDRPQIRFKCNANIMRYNLGEKEEREGKLGGI